MQQQIEILQVQHQQMMAQHQQFAQAGLIPGQSSLLPPGQTGLMASPQLQPSFMPPTGAFGQFQAPPPGNHRRAQSSLSSNHNYSNPQGGQSTSGNTLNNNTDRQNTSSPSQGHARRHSLALSEAKKAAALAQAKRSTTATDAESPSSPAKSASSSEGTESSPKPNIPSFKFPSSPERPSGDSPQQQPASSPSRTHGRSQSMQYNNSNNNNSAYRTNSPQRGFQFPSGTEQDYRSHQHNRSNSRNFEGNWRQPQQTQQHQSHPSQSQDFLSAQQAQFIPSHRSRGSYNSSMSSIQAFGMMPPHNQFPGQGGNQQQRKSLFAPYLPQASLPNLLAEGRLVSGVLRVNKKNRSDAYVSTDGLLDADIFICGSKDRNRALEGDLVAVELLEVDEVWTSKKEKEEKKKRKDATINSVEDGRSSASGGPLRRRGSLKQRPTQKKNDDVEVEGQSLLLVEEEALSDEVKPLYAGHVVAVIDRVPGQMFSGTLGLLRPSSQATKEKQDAERKDKGDDTHRPQHDKPKIVWFKPTDKRVPLIAIPTEQAPKDFVDNHDKYADKTFIASIKRWPITSLHPFGTLVEQLSSGDDVDIEIEAILRDNNFTADVFSESALSTVPEADTEIPEEVLNQRRNFGAEYVIGFAPKENLVEEAIHVKRISDEKVEIGVHIVDASYYVKENSPLDREARKRGTSVFLKQRTVNQFPTQFNEFVSFQAGRKSLALSVVFELDPRTFEISDTWIGESVISPRKIISYATGQSVLADEPGASSLVTQAETDYIKTLHLVSNMFRKQRLNLDQKTDLPVLALLNFIDDETVQVSSNIFEGSLVQQLFDEINIKVNSAIAQKLYAVLESKAFLRRHTDPILQKIESFTESVKNLNMDIDTTSSASIQKSILETKDGVIRKGLEALLYKCMNRAKYFVAGKVEPESHGHYFLNVPLYTHFNAPLRRYADLVVHRQLRSIITGKEYEEDIENLASIADTCNFKKDCAKNAQEQSIHLAVCQDIEKKTVATGQLVIDSIIIQVYESAFDVLIPDYGIEKRVHGDQLPLRKAEFDKKTRLLELYWEGGIDSATYIPDDEKNAKPSSLAPLRKGRVRASSAASALAQENALEQIAKLSLNTDKPSIDDTKAKEPQDYSDSHKVLAPYFENVITRVSNGDRVQEIRVLQHVPVLLSAELGSSIPCLTVRAVNPFTK